MEGTPVLFESMTAVVEAQRSRGHQPDQEWVPGVLCLAKEWSLSCSESSAPAKSGESNTPESHLSLCSPGECTMSLHSPGLCGE